MDRLPGIDLGVYDFDMDLTWMGFFVSADDKVYGRYGGRDAKSAEARLSLPGLRFAMQAALDAHRAAQQSKTAVVTKRQPVFADTYKAAKNIRKGECIHCHQVYEFRRADAKATGTFNRDVLWVYPLPENVGIALDVNQGNKVRKIEAGSPADKIGIQAGDILTALNGITVFSFADAQYGLHRAPAQGQTSIAWQRDGKALSGTLELTQGWRRTNPTWRPSMLDILPALSLYGDDLTEAERKPLQLGEKQLAFRQDKTVHKEAQRLGVQGGDIVIGIDDKMLEMTMLEFLGYIRRNYLVGDAIKLNIIRNGKRMDLTGKL
ncbi:hypothetical protein AYO44_18675 [Planctomycetaceae bacterium SCGC AG-212-F19]|nr:hypothetical protein AYO44_18675 [Planctomycetaceae bacterium SCGC AG-212-F19]